VREPFNATPAHRLFKRPAGNSASEITKRRLYDFLLTGGVIISSGQKAAFISLYFVDVWSSPVTSGVYVYAFFSFFF